ncbi:MAG: hypothetical protein GKR90_12715 [Pseudomonadales bacterium]|nr:hypothetical protein [Pseudomonadales bacterium]
MSELTITLVTACILGLMFIWLSARVIGTRVKNDVLIGDSGDQALLFSIRVQGNFTEYVPIFLIVLALIEAAGANQTALIVLAALFVAARLSHVLGMGEDANLKFRQAGIIGSFTAIGAVSLYGLFLALT